MRLAGDLLNPKAPMGQKMNGPGEMRSSFIPSGTCGMWLPTGLWPRFSGYGSLAKHMRFVECRSRKLARTLFHQMVKFGPKLERRQMILARLVEVGTELFAMAASCTKAMDRGKRKPRVTMLPRTGRPFLPPG